MAFTMTLAIVTKFDAIASAGPHRLVSEPEHLGAKDIRKRRGAFPEASDLAPLDENLLIKNQSDGLARGRRDRLL